MKAQPKDRLGIKDLLSGRGRRIESGGCEISSMSAAIRNCVWLRVPLCRAYAHTSC